MPYSHITRTAFGADALAYAKGNGKGHNDNEVRNEYIGCVNMLPDEVIPFEKQMQQFWDMADSRHTTQVNRCVVAFSKDELDPDKQEDGMKGLNILEEIARRNAPDNQSGLFMQRDGKSGLWHGHIITNDVNISDYKGINPLAYAHFHFQKIVDEVCQQYFDLAEPEAQPEKVNPSVRGKRIKNEQIRAANELERKRAAEEGREVDPDKIMAEHYIWQDDLRQRIKEAATGAIDEADFAQRLRLSGVELIPIAGKDKEPIRDNDGNLIYLHPATKKQPAHYTYELTDVSGFTGKIPTNLKSKSHKLGTNYQPEGVAKLFAAPGLAFKEEQQEAAQPVVLETPLPTPPRKRKEDTKLAPGSTEKSSEDKEMEDAKKDAASHALLIMQRLYGWQENPKTTGPDGKEHIDFTEWDRQIKAKKDTFEQFTRWRKDRRKELAKDGLKLLPIYVKDKITGHVSVHRSEFEAQFRDFLDRRDHPEKYITQEQQQNVPTEQPTVTPQAQPEQAKPQEHQPERQEQPQEITAQPPQAESQKTTAQQSPLMEKMRQINAKNERRWKEQQAREEGYEKS